VNALKASSGLRAVARARRYIPLAHVINFCFALYLRSI
jgi:hypothetical protein